MNRVRVRYSRHGKVRFLSSRDMARVLERAIRRAGMPVSYSQGFSPRPRIHFGLALSTGYESDAEYLDFDLDAGAGVEDPPDVEVIAAGLQPCVPKGIVITAVAEVPVGEPSLQDSVTSTSWSALVPYEPGPLIERAVILLDSPHHHIEIVRKGKQIREDLRPLLLDLTVHPAQMPCRDGHAPEPIATRAELSFELGTKPRSVRPAELLSTLGVAEPLLVRRTHQWIQRDARRCEPLGLTVASPHAEARAS